MLHRSKQRWIEPYGINLYFELPKEYIKTKKIKLIVIDENLLRRLIKLDEIKIYNGLYVNSINNKNQKGSKYLEEDEKITYKTNKFFCKKLGKKIKSKNDRLEIPLLNYYDESQDIHGYKPTECKYYYIQIYITSDYDFVTELNIRKIVSDNVLLQTKNTNVKNYMLCKHSQCNIWEVKIKYIYIVYYNHVISWDDKNRRDIYMKDEYLDIWTYEDKFLDLVRKYQDVKLKIKETSDGSIIIFKLNEDSNLNKDFLCQLNMLVINMTFPQRYNKKGIIRFNFDDIFLILQSK